MSVNRCPAESRAMTPRWALIERARLCSEFLATSFRRNIRPKVFVLEALTGSNLLFGGLENSLQPWGISHKHAFDFVFVLHRQQHSDRLAVFGHDHRSRFAGLDITT